MRIALLAVLLGATNGTKVQREKGKVGSFLWFSDFHYDEYYGTNDAKVHATGAPCNLTDGRAPKFSSLGCGSSEDLIKSTLNQSIVASKQKDGGPDWILYTGDATRHSADETPNMTLTVRNALHAVPQWMSEAYPDVPVVHLPPMDLGNNDFAGGDYYLDVYNSSTPCLLSGGKYHNAVGSNNRDVHEALPMNPYLAKVASESMNHFASPQEAEVFACGGYISREVLQGELYVIVLNTVLWSKEHEPVPTNPAARMDPLGQHSWLRSELRRIRSLNDAGDGDGGKVYITGHVPPLLQSFRGHCSLDGNCTGIKPNNMGSTLWDVDHVERYLATVEEFRDVVAAQFFAHVHSNELRAMPSAAILRAESGAEDGGSIALNTTTLADSRSLPINEGQKKQKDASSNDHGDNDSPPMFIGGSVAPGYTTQPTFSVVLYDRDSKSAGTGMESTTSRRRPTMHPIDIMTYHADLNNQTNEALSWHTAVSPPSLVESLGMSSLSNDEIRNLATRLVTNDTTWDVYWQHWYKGAPQLPCNATCRREEACLVACGMGNRAVWRECVGGDQDAICTLPEAPVTTASTTYTSLRQDRKGGGSLGNTEDGDRSSETTFDVMSKTPASTQDMSSSPMSVCSGRISFVLVTCLVAVSIVLAVVS